MWFGLIIIIIISYIVYTGYQIKLTMDASLRKYERVGRIISNDKMTVNDCKK